MQQDGLTSQLSEAIRQGKLDQADQILASLTPVPAELLAVAAELHFMRRRWVQAIALLSRIASPDAAVTLKLNLARNLNALQQHRPKLYERLTDLKRSDRYRLAPAKGGCLTIADCIDPEQPCVLTPGNDPAHAVRETVRQLMIPIQQGSPIGICGVGDGYLLAVFAKHPTKRFLDQEQVIHIVEPDEQLLFMCLMLHDYSQAAGPIQQRRFRWFVGTDWEAEFLDAITSDLMLLPASTMVRQSRDSKHIAQCLQNIADKYQQYVAEFWDDVDRQYDSLDAADLAKRFQGVAGDRPPRVLLLTTRFSSVLQYATRDVAEGFRQNGWQTRIVKETHNWQQVSGNEVRLQIADFQPDLVFQIDHLRHEHQNMVPANLPFVCWIQDHLTHLTNADAGRQIGARDFVLTFARPLFVETYDYPARQCIDMPMMLTRRRDASESKLSAPTKSKRSKTAGDDLVYVSNVSQQPEQLLSQMLSVLPTNLHDIARVATDRVLSLYERGACLQGHQQVRELLDVVAIDAGESLTREDHALVVDQLWNPLNITLYRQQALGWVADAAKALDLSLGIYGLGWKSHPRFAAHARGVIEHGEPLEQLTRDTPINLNLEPYVCFTHHRLLDGLSAGGFFIVREHPGNTALQALLNLLVEHDASAQTIEEARQELAGDARDQLEALLPDASCGVVDPSGDPVRQVRGMQRAGVLIHQPEALPRLPEVTFNDAVTCRALIEKYMTDADGRVVITAEQRASIADRLTFEVSVKRVVDQIATLLKEESEHAVKPEEDVENSTGQPTGITSASAA